MPPSSELPAEVAALREALDVEALSAELRRRGSGWPCPTVLPMVGSTNAEVRRSGADGAPEGFSIAAEQQQTGRGRLDRGWHSPRGAGLTFSVLLRPSPPTVTWGWLPLVAGLALVTAVRQVCACPASLKWPNDLLLGPAQEKGAGILAEAIDGAVVLGIGINVSTTVLELPAGATSLLCQGVLVARERLLVAVMLALQRLYADWTEGDGDAQRSGVLAAYRRECATLGHDVAVHLPHAEALYGRAESIDGAGGLQIRTAGGIVTTVVAADVVHVRPW